MKNKWVWAALLLFTVATAKAQDEKGYEDGKWVLKGVTGVNMSQTAMSNWSAGGENSVSGNAYVNGTLLRKSGHWLWQTSLVADYGLSKNKSEGTKKVSDNLQLSSQLGYSINEVWFYTVMGDFKTQFAKGYNYPDREHYISTFMAPGYANLSPGIEYRPRANFSFYLSPASGKFTFVRDKYLSDLGSFGVDAGKKFKAEIGAYFKARAEQTVMENVTLVSTLDLFTSYDEQFGNVDVNWDVLISMKINKFLSATINTTLKYDNDVKRIDSEGNRRGAKIQFKEVLGVGVAYNF
ncbi:DUF3078 domain-containing protein [Parabacteroides sp. OttesenSCG-928-N08]|nr:DUF3078 domain-containing protein [Parabacteroides sp. OttesenSCG-928-N08]